MNRFSYKQPLFKLGIIIFSLVIGHVCYAQQQEDTSLSISENDIVIKDELIARLALISYFSSNFNQVVFDEEGNALQDVAGEIAISKPNKIRWHTKQPEDAETIIISDGATLWFYDPFIEQVSAHSLNNAIANTPILLLTSEDSSLWNNYMVSSISANTYLIKATDSNSQVKTLELTFENQLITAFVIKDATGQISKITLSDIKVDKAPAIDLFNFVIPEGVYLDDQR